MILVTGYKGYIGNKLFNKLNLMGCEVVGIDLKDGHDIADCLPKNKNFDYVFHLAALPSVEYSVLNPSYTMKHNVLATSKLLEWSKDNKVKRFIFSSSSAIYGDGNGPKSPYGLHKLMSEQECKLYSELYQLDTVCLRYYNLYSEDQKYGGAYSTAISAWMEKINIKKPLRIDGNGEQTRDFVHVDDVIKANLFCMNHKENFNGKFYDIGSGKSISLNYIKNYIDQFNEVKWDHRPERIGDVKHTKANIQEMLNLGWTSEISIEEGLERCFKRRNI